MIKHRIFISKEVINLYISYTLNPQLRSLKIDFTLCTWLFVSVKLVKNADLDNTSVAATVQDLILCQNFYYLKVACEKVALFLELI